MAEIDGNKTGLAPQALHALERIFRRRVPLERIVTPELVRSLAEASRETKRQVGALIHRSGQVDRVIVGDASGLLLPEIGRLRAAQGRFRALRLVHTHLFGEPLSRDDLTDLTRLRLDLVAAVLLSAEGEPRSFTWAYNVPTRGTSDSAFHIEGPLPWGSPLPDFGQLIASLEAEFTRQAQTWEVKAKDGRAIVVHVSAKGRGAQIRAEAQLAELERLAETAGVAVVSRVIQLRDQPDPRYVLGRGKLEEVVISAIELGVETLIFDCNLTATQVASIARRTDLRIIDRTQLILDIFAQRATTRDGKLQVELAQLKYALPRLGAKDDALSRLTGGIGGRGPGETALEIGRRRARERLTRLERELKELVKQRSRRRARRDDSGIPVVSIVGYTNAGKSTLLNTLTQAGVLAEDKLFATLDTKTRRLHLPSGLDVVIADTVGFIRDMPKDLLVTFRATFEEAARSSLIIELIDGADPEQHGHTETTTRLLDALELSSIPRLRVYNKIDKLEDSERHALQVETNALAISARDRSSLDGLLRAIDAALADLGYQVAPHASPLDSLDC